MNDVEGLNAAALLYLVTGVLLLIATFVRRDLVRRPAALLSLVTCGIGAVLMVRHAPIGAPWEPPQFSTDHGVKSSVRFGLGRREGGFPEGVKGSPARPGRAGRVETASAGGADDGEAEPRGGAQGSSGSGIGRLLASFEDAPRRDPRFIQDCADCPEMAIVPGGSAIIGAAGDDPEAGVAEKPAREVRVWPGFAIARGEVTVAQYARFMAATGRPAPSCRGHGAGTGGFGLGIGHVLPVTCVSWQDAAAYTAWLRRHSGKPYRLPTAAEWEYAALAGRTAAEWHAGGDNDWGIVAMGGGVAEHVADCWRETIASIGSDDVDVDVLCSRRMIKDGADAETARWQRPHARRGLEAVTASPTVGFRVVRDLR